MDSAALARWRLRNLLLRDTAATTPGEVIGRLGASQGQDFLPALWSMAQRAGAVTTYDDVAAAFDRGELLRTHVLRPTWHLVAPTDLRWLLAATAPRVHAANAYYYRKLGVDESAMRTVRSVLETELPGRELTREFLAGALGRAGVDAAGPRLAYLLMWAELEGWICSGARSGRQQTYALLEERAGPGDTPAREVALARLAQRYFETRGPATVKDLAGWATLTLGEARSARATLQGFSDVDIEGRTYVVSGDPPDPSEVVVDLVQAYDEVVMSYSESKDVLAEREHDWSLKPPSSYLHAVLVDGQLVGHWRYDRDAKGRAGRPQVFTYRDLSRAEQASLTTAEERFLEFAGSIPQEQAR